MVDPELLGKVIGAGSALFTVFKVVHEFTYGRWSRLREHYKFSQEFFKSLKSDAPMHPFALEKGYQALAGTAVVSGKEVRYILSLRDSARVLKDYVEARRYLVFEQTADGERIGYKPRCRRRGTRVARKIIYFVFYMLFVVLAVVPPFFADNLLPTLTVGERYGIVVPVSLFFGVYAWFALVASEKVKQAEFVVEHQLVDETAPDDARDAANEEAAPSAEPTNRRDGAEDVPQPRERQAEPVQ